MHIVLQVCAVSRPTLYKQGASQKMPPGKGLPEKASRKMPPGKRLPEKACRKRPAGKGLPEKASRKRPAGKGLPEQAAERWVGWCPWCGVGAHDC